MCIKFSQNNLHPTSSKVVMSGFCFWYILLLYKIGKVCEVTIMSKPYKVVVADDYRISRTFLR